MQEQCPGIDWSFGAAAPTYSQLAGVLAGFVFTALILLLQREARDSTSARTLCIFFPAFLVLGLASFCYGLVALNPSGTACERTETLATTSSGMLGLGTVLIAGGVAWLAAGHLQGPDSADGNSPALTRYSLLLQMLARLLVYGAAWLVSSLMGVTVAGYLRLMSVSSGLLWTVSLAPCAVATCAITVSHVAHRRAACGKGWLDENACRRILRFTVVGAIVYSVAASVFAGVASGVTGEQWTPLPVWAAVATVVFGLILPMPILVGLVYTVPRFMHASQELQSP